MKKRQHVISKCEYKEPSNGYFAGTGWSESRTSSNLCAHPLSSIHSMLSFRVVKGGRERKIV